MKCCRYFVVICLLLTEVTINPAGGQCESAKLTPSDGTTWDLFGRSVCIDGEVAIIGSEWFDSPGSAHVYRFNGPCLFPGPWETSGCNLRAG